MEIPRFTAIACTVGLATAAASGCGDPQQSTGNTAPTSIVTQKTFPTAVNTEELIDQIDRWQEIFRDGIRIDRYDERSKYPKLNLWGLVQYCAPGGELVQETVDRQQASYTDKDGVRKTAPLTHITRKIFEDSSVCDDNVVTKNELTPKSSVKPSVA